MPLAKCPRCNKLFEKASFPVCSACQGAEEADYDRVRATLDKTPNLNVEQLAADAEIDVAVISRMLKDGVIANVTALDTALDTAVKCGMCGGAPAISLSKKLCQACLDKLNARVTKMQSKIKLGGKKDVQVETYLGNVRSAYSKKHGE